MPLLFAALLLAACDGGPTISGMDVCPRLADDETAPRLPSVDSDGPDVSTRNLRAWVDLLSSERLRGRHAGSPESRATAGLLAAQMQALGLAAPFGEGGHCQAFTVLDAVDVNVVGHLRGSGSAGAAGRPVVLVGAHYDGQGVEPAGRIFPGADDNASGVAALLETARLATHRGWPFDLVFVAFGGEEVGRLGARAWAAHPSAPLARLRLMVNLDMVGRPWPADPTAAIGFLTLGGEAETTRGSIERAGERAGVAVRDLRSLFREEELLSDSAVFRELVPTVHLSTGLHADHHQPSDGPEGVDDEQVGRAVRLVLALLEELA